MIYSVGRSFDTAGCVSSLQVLCFFAAVVVAAARTAAAAATAADAADADDWLYLATAAVVDPSFTIIFLGLARPGRHAEAGSRECSHQAAPAIFIDFYQQHLSAAQSSR